MEVVLLLDVENWRGVKGHRMNADAGTEEPFKLRDMYRNLDKARFGERLYVVMLVKSSVLIRVPGVRLDPLAMVGRL